LEDRAISSCQLRKKLIDKASRVVVKLGTATLMNEEGDIALSRFYGFVEELASLKKSGREVILVTSGAVGLGRKALKLVGKPKTLPLKQACAAVGQGRLMSLYCDAFERLDVVAAQVLLSEADFTNRRRYLNLRSTINKLLELGVLPVINENDTVSTDELEMLKNVPELRINFGDNDKLSALVASKVDADLLVILTDVDGIYTCDPSLSEARLIDFIDSFSPEIEALGNSSAGLLDEQKVGRGGIATKLTAAKIAAQTGCATVIAGGKQERVLTRIVAGEALGTFVVPQKNLKGKQRWIAFATTLKASLVINDGAKEALISRKKSLLPKGVLEVRGDFERGDVVAILDTAGLEVARGMVNYASVEARKISGKHSDEIDNLLDSGHYDALITRDNIVLT
jgi:glutamate 5-kinase